MFLTLLPMLVPALPLVPHSLFAQPAQAAEFLSSPQFVDAAVLPNGQVGLIFVNDQGGGLHETRFKSYFVESGLNPSQQLSTSSAWYPQLATFQGNVIAAYVDDGTTSPTYQQLRFRISPDNGASWGAEFSPFGTETFDTMQVAPLVVASRDGARLYVFSCCVSSLPQYRYTTDASLVTWTAAAAAGDASMHIVANDDCTVGGPTPNLECVRSHDFQFVETAASGQWLYIARSDSGYTKGARGTQVGTLGGSWSTQVDHGGSGGLNCCSEGQANAFVDRSGNIYYIRVSERGERLYSKKSTDGGLTWAAPVQAYAPDVALYTAGAPVGLYVPGYSRGEYVWYAGFGGDNENTLRVIPLWTQSTTYIDSGTARLFGSAGGDWDFGTAYPYAFGRRDIPTSVGAYKSSAQDLSIPGRLLDLSLSRSYNSADLASGPLGPGWTHSFNWSLVENGALVELRRGDGRRDQFARNPDTTYSSSPNVFDVLTKNGDSTFTLTLKNQTQYEFSTAGKLTRIHEPAGNQLLLTYGAAGLSSVTDSVGRVVQFAYTSGINAALAKSYVASDPPYSLVPDSGGELTDGVLGAEGFNAYEDSTEVGWIVPTVDITVDMGAAQPLSVFRSYFYENINLDRIKPASVEILTSTDNSIFTSRGTTLAASAVQSSGGSIWRYDLSVASVSARWVRFHVARGSSGIYILASELQVYPTGFAPPVAQGGTNLALTRTYQESIAPSLSYPDSGGELTNNTLGVANSFGDASWQGHQNLGGTPLDVRIDLGSAQRLGVTRSFHYHSPADGIYKPTKIEVFTSTDDNIYTSRGFTTAPAAVNDSLQRWRYELDLGGVTARYVRFRLTSGGQWLFSSEMQVFADGAGPIAVPSGYGERLTAIQDSSGRRVSYSYDQLGRLSAVVDKIGNAGTSPVLHTWHYTYDGQTQHVVRVIDPDSRTRVINSYDTEGRLAIQADGAGSSSLFGYGTQQTTVTDPRGHVTTQNFDSRWRLTSQLDTVGANNYSLQYLYEDAYQNLTATIDRNGNRTDYTYDARGNVLTKTDPQVPPAPRYVTAYQYDTKNNLTQITDARSFVTTNAFDATTNVKLSTTQQITAGPSTYATTKWEYGDGTNPGLPTKIISPRGNTTGTPNYTYSQSLSYDAQGNLIQRIDADTNKTTFSYDGLSRQTTMVDPDGYAPILDTAHHTWTTVYDENDRVTEVRDPFNHSSFTAYDGAGNRTSATDRDGNVTTYAYDGAARLQNTTQKPDPIGQPSLVYTTSVVRDGDGNATSVSQDKQGGAGTATVVTDYAYDALNRMTSFISHPTGVLNLTTSYVLDGNGNATKRTTADAVDTNYQYDAMSRLKQVSATGLTTITYGYDELSRRTSMGDVTGSSSYTYDGLGRLTAAVQPNGNLGYGYDLDSNRTTLTYPTVGSVTYVFSPAGRLSSLTDWGARQSTYTYFASGLAKTVTVPGGMTTTYGYDYAQRLTSLLNATAGGTITSDTYTLDNEGNRTAIDELMPAVIAASVKVNSDAGTAIQDHPAIALGAEVPNPASYLIWDDQRDGATNSNIYFSRRDPVTGAWSANVKVNTDATTRIQANPAIATDSSNNAYAVWDDFRDATNNQNIYYSKRTAAGTWLTPNLKVNDGTGNTNERNPRIAGTAAGAETAVWVDARSNQLNIYSSRLASGGSTWEVPNKKVTDNTSSSVAKDFPDVAVGADGTSYAVWQDSRNGNADIYFSSLAPGPTSTWTANEKISDDAGTAGQTKARVGVDSAGNLIVAWIDARTSPAHVRVRRRPANTTWTAAPASIDISPSPANVQSVALSVRPDGFAWVVWGDTRAGATNQDIWGSRYDPTNTWSTPVRLDDDPGTTANQSSPAVAFGPAEEMVAWRDNRLSANGDTQARRLQVIAGMSDHFTLSYDGLNRLTRVAGPVAETFALDGASNITSRTGPTQTDAYDLANRLTSDGSQSFTWSNADRLTNRGSDLFGYDALDRLISSTVGGSARTYAYNGDGLLQSRTGSGATTFLWDPATSPSRELKQGSDNIIYGLGPLYVVKADATTVTFARDGSKNVRAEVSSAGAVTAAFRYRSYGLIAQSTAALPTYLGLANQTIDPSGLVYMRARWYDPTVGRFITRDPLAAEAAAPADFNGYMYAGANPIVFIDPTGLRQSTGSDDEGGGCSSVGACLGSRPNVTTDAPNKCSGLANCANWLDGVVVIQNADGLLGALVSAVGGFRPNTVTFSSTVIASNGLLDDETVRHEFGHVRQAKSLGVHYVATYVSELFFQVLHHGFGDAYRYNSMEIDANLHAGLPEYWHVDHR